MKRKALCDQRENNFFMKGYDFFSDVSNPKRHCMIRKLKSGEYRIYSRKKDPKTNKRRNLGTFSSLIAAKKHEKAIQYFKHH
jgi:hypothetical protein